METYRETRGSGQPGSTNKMEQPSIDRASWAPAVGHGESGARELDFDALLKRHAHTFRFASRFLPRPERRATSVLYGFFRTLDDLVDNAWPLSGASRHVIASELDMWQAWFERGMPGSPPRGALGAEVRDVINAYRVPAEPLRDFLDGMRSDLPAGRRVRTVAELEAYCYQVAGTVGIALCPILGARGAEALEAARNLGIAMQVTNVVRDVGGDLRMNRVYLPQEDLVRAGLSDGDLFALAASDVPIPNAFKAVMRDLIQRADERYERGLSGVPLLSPETQLPILVAGRLYQRVLRAVERTGYDTIRRRAYTSTWEKGREAAVCALALWTASLRRRSAAARHSSELNGRRRIREL